MISVSATAVGLVLGIPVPKLGAVLPTSLGWVLIILVLGAAFTAMAILGCKTNRSDAAALESELRFQGHEFVPFQQPSGEPPGDS
jgi:hypothetical protein